MNRILKNAIHFQLELLLLELPIVVSYDDTTCTTKFIPLPPVLQVLLVQWSATLAPLTRPAPVRVMLS
jgi:hypothetical protein